MSRPRSTPTRPSPLPPLGLQQTDGGAALRAALEMVRDRGPIGERSLDSAIAHGERFARAIPNTASRVVDIGSGGGLPGLVIAVQRPAVLLTLVERRVSRADLLRRAVAALGVDDRVAVCAEDVAAVSRRWPGGFDVVTARSFGSPAVTARAAAGLLAPGGLLLVSEPPEASADRWTQALGEAFVDEGVVDGLRRLHRR